MKKTLSNILTVMLALLMALYVFPYEVIATMPDATEPEEYDTSVLDESVFEEDNKSKKEAYILFEDTEQRDETTKVFRMSDGSYTAAVYPMQVHFEENGEMREINNQFELKTDEDGEMYYENTASPVKITLPAGLSEDNAVTYSKDEYSVSFSLSEMKFSGGISKINSDDTEYKNKLKKKIIADNTDDEDYIEKYGLSKEEAELIDVPYDVAVERLNTAEQELENVKCNVFYSNIFDDVDLRYSVVGTTLKDEIILNSSAVKVKSYEFTITTNQLTAVLSEDNSISLQNSTGEEIFKINSPYMYDTIGATSEDIKVTLKDNKDGTYTYKLKPDKKWLEADERVYPIVIDPPVTESNFNTVKDTTAINANSTGTLGYTTEKNLIKVGNRYDSSLGTYCEVQGLLYNPLPDVLKNGSTRIINAQMALYGCSTLTAYNKDLQINAYRITSDWNTGNIQENGVIALKAQPVGHDTDVLDYVIVNDSVSFHGNAVVFNITEAAQEWMDGISTNYGIALCAENFDTGSNHFVNFIDSTWTANANACPKFVYEYRDSRGIEDYWSFTSVSAGRFGTAAVNNFNGNLVITQELVTGCGNNMPVSVSLIYSHNAPYEQNSGFGVWRTNYHMSVTASGIDDYPYYFTDADGTRFYLKKDGNEYKDEDGCGWTMTIPNGDYKYQITDKNKTVYYFDYNGRLKRIVDSNGNYNHIYYEGGATGTTNNRITEIREGSKMSDSYQAATFTYNGATVTVDTLNDDLATVGFVSETNRQLKAIYYEDYDSTNTNDHATRIEYEAKDDGTYYPQYIYNGLGNQVTIRSPKANGIFRVTTLATGYGHYNVDDSDILEQYDFVYSHNATKIIDSNDNAYTYQFNNYGQTVGVVDHTTSIGQKYDYALQDGEHEGYENKLLQSSKAVSPSSNRLNYTSFTSESNLNHYTIYPSTSTVTKTMYYGYGNTGTNCMYLSKSQSEQQSTFIYQSVSGLSTGNYTLSMFVSTKGVKLSGNGVSAQINVFSGSTYRAGVKSSYVTYTEDGEWIRLQTSIRIISGDTSVNVGVCFDSNTYGAVCVDDMQFEYNITGGASNTDISGAGSYNLLYNAHFLQKLLTGWGGTGFTGASRETSDPRAVRNKANVTGDINTAKNLIQTVYVDGEKGDSFIAGCWVKANSIQLYENPKRTNIPQAGLYISFYNDGNKVGESIVENINTGTEDWQYLLVKATAPGTYDQVSYSFSYSYNTGSASVSTPFLFKESYGQSYAYDANGNLVGSTDAADSYAQFAYQDDKLSSSVSPTGSRYIYGYDDTTGDNMYALSNAGQRIDNVYNASGDVTNMTISDEKVISVNDLSSLQSSCYIVNSKTGRALSLHYGTSAIGGVEVFTRNHYRTDIQKWWFYVFNTDNNIYSLRIDGKRGYGIKTLSETQQALTAITTSVYPENTRYKFVANDDGTFYILTGASGYENCLSDSDIEHESKDGSFHVYSKAKYEDVKDTRDQEYRWVIMSSTTSLKMMSESGYSEDGRFLTKSIDQSGYETQYSYYNSGMLRTTIDANGGTTNYTYDEMNNTTSVTATVRENGEYVHGASVAYTYTDGLLDTITSGGSDGVVYDFDYDKFGRTTNVKVGGESLVWNTYTDKLLTTQTYGNDDAVTYTYDALDRVIQKKYNDVQGAIQYYYDPNGNLYKATDSVAGTTTTTEYDLANRIAGVTLTSLDGKTLLAYQGIRYNDQKGTVKSSHTAIFDETNGVYRDTVYKYTYGDPHAGQMPDMLYKLFAGGREFSFTYDVLGRLTKRTLSTGTNVSETYTYKNAANTTNRTGYTTTLVDQLTDFAGTTHTYTYDKVGNIKSETIGSDTKSYEYDSLNRLVRVNDETVGKTYVYDYDNRGNLLRYYTYNYTTAENLGNYISVYEYTYGDSTWKDKLTSYKKTTGTTVTLEKDLEYDNIGNPTSWVDGKIMSWTNGRRLTYITDPDIGNTTYKYNSDGLRTAKLHSRDTEYYILDGSYVGEKTTIDGTEYVISYIYDENGSPAGITVNGSTYYFVKNVQGDVIGIVNYLGNVMAKYTYDAWGKPISVYNVSGLITSETHIAHLNPFRYRGYMYDQETGFYYLNTRYYDPVVGRFLNADDPSLVTATPNALTDKNLYAYCDNNPVMRSDDGGEFWMVVGAAVGALVGGAVSAISQYATTGKVDWKVVGVNAVSGAVSGALATTGIGLIASVGANAVIGGGTYIAEQAVKGEEVTIGGVIASTAAGGIGGAIGGKGMNAKGLSTAWKSASKGISRELRRANTKYAAKQIAKYNAEKLAIKSTINSSVSRYVAGAIGNSYARYKFGY